MMSGIFKIILLGVGEKGGEKMKHTRPCTDNC